MPQDVEAIAEQVFSALADPTRRAILAELALGRPATATDLAARLPITRQAVAEHLAPLAQARLVTADECRHRCAAGPGGHRDRSNLNALVGGLVGDRSGVFMPVRGDDRRG